MKYLLSYIIDNFDFSLTNDRGEDIIFKIMPKQYADDVNENEIYVKNLTHFAREYLVKILDKAKLKYDGVPFNIFSES